MNKADNASNLLKFNLLHFDLFMTSYVLIVAFPSTGDASYDNLRSLSDFNVGIESGYTKPGSCLLLSYQHLRSRTRERRGIDWKVVGRSSGSFLYDLLDCPFPTHRSHLQVIYLLVLFLFIHLYNILKI